MQLSGCRIGILIESDYYEPEIFYYRHRFAEEGVDVHFLSRLWGESQQTFSGHEFGAPFTCTESFEDIGEEALRDYDAIIVPSGMVADRLRYTESIDLLPPATRFLQLAFARPQLVKGLICHGMWLLAPLPELVRGRRVVAHNNLLGDVRNMGACYVDEDVVIDDDLITARTGDHCHQFIRAVIDTVTRRRQELPRGTQHQKNGSAGSVLTLAHGAAHLAATVTDDLPRGVQLAVPARRLP
jgi:protease I